jgi:hypothetical protein
MVSTPYQTNDPLDTTVAPNPTIGFGPADYVGFYGAFGAPQTSGPNQAQFPINGAVGNGTAYSLTEGTVTTVTANTTGERPLTLTGALATDMLIPHNKLTGQAGLAVLSGRVSAANTIQMGYGNNTGSAIVPASEVCQFVTVSAALQLTATLTPAAVAAATTAEQIFTVPGVFPGQVVFVNKPTTQVGLGIHNARVVGNNQVAISFVNFTAAPITPTAGEVYQFFATNGLGVVGPVLEIGVPAVATAVSTITTQENTLTATQVLADDIIVGSSKPTLNAGVGVCSSRVSSAGNIAVTYVNPTAGSVTPTAEMMQFEIIRHNQLPAATVQTASIAPISVAANTSAEQTFTVPNLIAGTFVGINKPTLTPGIVIAGVRVSATNTLAINFMNINAAAIVPPTEVYSIVYSPNLALTAGTWIKQFGSQLVVGMANLVTAIRTALVATGFIAGA